MKSINENRLETDLAYRFEYLAEFIEFGQSEIAAIHGAAAAIAPLVPSLVDAVYEKLFCYNATKRHFVPRQSGYEGQPPNDFVALNLDHDMIQFRKQHLGRYFVALVTKPYDDKLLTYLDFVGKIHTPKAGSKELNVPLIQMNALLGYVSDLLIEAILKMGLDRAKEIVTLRAFNKLLWIQNDSINRHYQHVGDSEIL